MTARVSPRLPWFEEAAHDLGGRPSGAVSAWLEDVARVAAERAAAWEQKFAAERAARGRDAAPLHPQQQSLPT